MGKNGVRKLEKLAAWLRENKILFTVLVSLVAAGAAGITWVARAEESHQATAEIQSRLTKIVERGDARDAEQEEDIRANREKIAFQEERDRIRRCVASGKSLDECL